VDITAEIFEHLFASLHNGLREDHPALSPWDVRKEDARERAPRERQEASAKEFGERLDGNDEALAPARYGEPGATIGGEPTAGHQHVDVWMPLECACPGMQDGEGADPPTEEMRIGAETSERFERRPEQRWQEEFLVGSKQPSQLGREGEDDVKVGHRQE